MRVFDKVIVVLMGVIGLLIIGQFLNGSYSTFQTTFANTTQQPNGLLTLGLIALIPVIYLIFVFKEIWEENQPRPPSQGFG